jgi:glycosyltransferase involved in cell wall biosynthesis
MRILQIIPSITNYFTFLEELTQTGQHAGMEMALAASPRHFDAVTCYRSQPSCPFFPVSIPQGMNPRAHWNASRDLANIVRQFKPDLIHVHVGSAIFAVSLARRKGWPPIMATHHGLLGPSMQGWKGRLASMAEHWTFGRVDQICLLNGSDAEWLKNHGVHTPAHVYRSCGLGCKLEAFHPVEEADTLRQQARNALGIARDEVVFIFVGRQVWFKGFDLTLRAFRELRHRRPGIKLLLLGEPYRVHPTGLDAHETEWMHNHPDVIRVGWVKDVAKYLAIADVNVFPSEREGMPVNLMESLAMGVPVITRNTRGCGEVVQHNQTGWLLPSRSLPDLISAMERFADESSLRLRLRTQCIAERERLDRRHWVNEQLELYQKWQPVHS